LDQSESLVLPIQYYHLGKFLLVFRWSYFWSAPDLHCITIMVHDMVCRCIALLYHNTVPLKHNITLAHTSRFARDLIIAKKRDVALISLASIHPCKCFSNTCEQNGCHAPLIGDYSITSKSTCASECNVVLEQYIPYIHQYVAWCKVESKHLCILFLRKIINWPFFLWQAIVINPNLQ